MEICDKELMSRTRTNSKACKSIDAMMRLYMFLFYEKKLMRGNLY